MPSTSPATRVKAARDLRRESESWERESPPSPTPDGYEWRCNACPYRTAHGSLARDHVTESLDGSFPHMMLEMKRGAVTEKAIVRRRVVVDPREAVVVQRKKGTT